MSRVRSVFLLSMILTLTACKQAYVKPTNSLQPERYSQPRVVSLRLDLDELLYAAYEHGPGDIMASAMAAASAHQSAPVTSYGEGLATYAVSIAAANYINSAEVAKQKREAERRAIELESFLVDVGEALIQDANPAGYLADRSWVIVDDSPLQLTLKPQLRLSSDHRVLTVYLLATMNDPALSGTKALVYLNEFEYQSRLVDVQSPLDYWLENDGAAVRELFKVGLHDVLQALDESIFDVNAEKQKATTIRYENASGTHFERGYLIRAEADRIWYKTLRGGFKSVFIES